MRIGAVVTEQDRSSAAMLDEDTAAAALARLADAGATEFVADIFGTPAERTRTLTTLATLDH